MEDEIPAGESPYVDDASVDASLAEVVDAPPLRARWAGLVVDGVQMPPNGLVLISYAESMVWARPTEDVPDPD